MAIYKNTPPVVTNGLILHLDAANRISYPGSGTTWTDLSGNGYNTFLTSGPTFSNSNGGNIVFDGTNDYAEAVASSAGNATDSFSWGCWVNHGSNVASGDIFFNRGRDGMGNGWSLLAGSSGTNPMVAVVTTSPSTAQISAIDTTTTYQPNTWYHIFGTWQAGVAVKCYVNGVLKATTATTSTVLRSSSSGWVIGSIGITAAYASVNIANAMVYSRTLLDNEILQNYNALKSRFGLI